MADTTAASRELWARLARPFDSEEMVDAVLGLSRDVVSQLTGVIVAASEEADELLEVFPALVRKLSTTMTARAERCTGEVRGPVRWAETVAARASTAGNPDVFVCDAPHRSWDIDENRCLVAALLAIRSSGRGVDRRSAEDYDDAELRRARANAALAHRYLGHASLAKVSRGRLEPRALRRARSGMRRHTYRPAVAVVDLAHDPLTADDVLPFCDQRTRAQHALLVALADGLIARGVAVPPFRAYDGALVAGPLRYEHPRRLGERSGRHGVLVGDVLVDVPDRLRDRNRDRVEEALAARAGDRPSVAVLGSADVDRALAVAVSRLR